MARTLEVSYGTRYLTICYHCDREDAIWTVYCPENDLEMLLCDTCKCREVETKEN